MTGDCDIEGGIDRWKMRAGRSALGGSIAGFWTS